MKKWYELNIKDRYEKVYKNFTLKEFLEWWSDGSEDYMELRFSDYKHAQYCAEKLKLSVYEQSVFVNKAWQIENVLKLMRKMSTIWFGINPRRKLKNKHGKLMFGGKDIYIPKSKYVFVDIDRVESNKDGPATNEDLMNADFLANKLLEELSKEGFNKNYIKICSGNGLQLLIKLDVPIELPLPKMDENTGLYYEDNLFVEAKQIIQKGIGKILPKFSSMFSEEYKVEIDKTGFNIGRVGALPFSFNHKYKTPLPRGIIEIKNDGKNEGFSDYLRDLFHKSDVRVKATKAIKEITPLMLSAEHKIIQNQLKKNVIIDLMLNYQFPNGGINNTLWYGIKILLHDAGVTIRDSEYVKIHQLLKSIHNRSFTENGLEPQYKNNYNGAIKEYDISIVPAMVNKYLRLNKVKSIKSGKEGFHPPVFPVSPRGRVIQDITIDIKPDLLKKHSSVVIKLEEIKDDPLTDVTECTKELIGIRRGDKLPEYCKLGKFRYTSVGTIKVKRQLEKYIISFLKVFLDKWGTEKTVYMMKYYMDDYLNFRRW